MSARKVVDVAAAYYVLLFGVLVQQSHLRRQRAVARSGARPRTRRSFDELQDSLSRAEFTRAFRMSLETYENLLSLLKLDLTRDMRIASRSSGGRVDPEVRLALTIRMFSGASHLDLMMLFRVASSTVHNVFHRTIASPIERKAMPGLPFQQNELQNLALSFTTSRQPPNRLYGCLAALDGICIEVQKPRTCTDTEIVSRLSSSAELGKMRQVRRKRTRVAVCLSAKWVLSFLVRVQTKRAVCMEWRATFIISVQRVQTFCSVQYSMERP
jgi:hypothetical protein